MCEIILFEPTVANKNEIEEYKNKFKGIMKNSAKKKFTEKIITQYNKNIFNFQIEEYISESEIKKKNLKRIKWS